MRRPATLWPRYARDDFAPGDTVEGVLELREPMDGVRRLDAYLRYLDRSPSYTGAVTHGIAEPLHVGPVEPGDVIPFAFTLPPDGLPAWDDPATEGMGTLSWALVIQADIASGLDTTTTHAVPVTPDVAVWRGPAPADEGEIKESGGRRWDVSIAPDRWSLRRGETVAVEVRIDEPKAGRDSLEVGLMCQAYGDVEVTHTDSEGSRSTRRDRRFRTLFEDRPTLDTAAATQTLEFQLPADGPFSYDGDAFGFRWFVLAKEARRLRSDPHRSARLQVLP